MSCLRLVLLSMEPALIRENSSRSKVTDASRDLGCDLRSIHQPRSPYQTGALASTGGAICEGVADLAMPQFLTLAANGKTLQF